VIDLISFQTLLGKKVIGMGGYILDEIIGASIDTKTWKVAQLHVKLTDTATEELGYKKRLRSSIVNMPIKMVQAVGDVVNVSPSLKELSESNKITEFRK
jgi:sporulation protein YlmC with PRC-barrel domain